MANMTKRVSLVGKGDRPRKVDHKKFSDNYERIFSGKAKQPLETPLEKKD
jgi:hypothetical protein